MDLEVTLEFIPCDLHKSLPAVKMEVTDNDKVVFKCATCTVYYWISE